MNLNLETKNKSDEILKAYLEKNATEELADKINNGVRIQKDGKTLINRKTLATFMTFAAEEAKKQAEEGAKSACVEDKVVFGWLMHYFEEDDIIGKLLGEDGTEYKPPIKTKAAAKTKATAPVTAPKPEPPKERQESLFDMMTAEAQPQDCDTDEDDEEPTEEEIAEAFSEKENEIAPDISRNEPKYTPSPMYQTYLNLQEKYKGCLLFLKLGDFYEILGDGAVTVSKELDLTLTGKEVGLENRIPMAGLPYHAMDRYLAKLIQKGYKVALAEDMSNPNRVRLVQGQQKIDTKTGEILSGNEEDYEPEELTEEEMRKFDGDIDDDIPTVSKITEEPDEELEKDRELVKAFDKDALCILSELFDGEINIA